MGLLFSKTTLDAVTRSVSMSEKRHRGELRVIIEGQMPLLLLIRDISPRQRATLLFRQHVVSKTAERCGVMIYLQVADRCIEILADEGIAAKVPQNEWEAICLDMSDAFRKGSWHAGILEAVDRVGELLVQHFPADKANPNELPDTPLVI